MAKIIDPFGSNDDNKDGKREDEVPDVDQLQSFVSDLMSSLGLSPSDIADVAEPVLLALVLRTPRTLTSAEVDEAIKRAFGAEAEYIGCREGKAGSSVHLVEIEKFGYLVSAYVPGDNAAQPPQLREHPLLESLGEHVAFITIEPNEPFGDEDDDTALEDEDDEGVAEIAPLGHIEGVGEEEDALAEAEMEEDDEFEDDEDPWTTEEGHMAKVLAELIDDRVESIYVVPTGEALAYSPFMKDLMRGPDPMYYFLEKEVPVREFEADDPRLAAAATEARLRFEEFRTAFEARNPDDDESIYAVKIAMTEDDAIEHMWINVSDIVGDEITGELANEPRDLEEVELGDEITTTIAELEDWVIQRGTERLGGFSLAILFGGGEGPTEN